MRIVNRQEMREIEKETFSKFCITESIIIENIGVGAANFIESLYYEQHFSSEIIFLIGQGNNAADGLAAARHLQNMGFNCRAFRLYPEGENSVEAKHQLAMAEAFGVKISEVQDLETMKSYFRQGPEDLLIVDAILGSGAVLPISNYLFDIIQFINGYSHCVVSIDIPSGIDVNNGAMSSAAIEADFTLAVGLPKVGHFVADGAKNSGELSILDASFPKEALKNGDKYLLGPETGISSLKKRDRFAHKNHFGHTLVVGGSVGLTGAIIMGADAALCSGTGLVTASTWNESYPELASRIRPEVMIGRIPEVEGELDESISKLGRYDSIVIGPGLGRNKYAREVVLKVLGRYPGPVVVDADAISVLSLKDDSQTLLRRVGPTIFTPHIGEFASFINVDKTLVMANPLGYLREVVDQTNSIWVLKGPSTFLGFPNGQIFINHYPNDGLAKGGSGDILAGILGGLLAQNKFDEGHTPKIFSEDKKFFDSVCMGVTIHTLAGKLASKKLGPRAMTATSVIDHIPDAFNELKEMY